MPVVPFARAMYLCDSYSKYESGKIDLNGLFNAIQSEFGFPFDFGPFCVFAQLTGGMGRIPFFIDIRLLESDSLIHTTGINFLEFPNRSTVVKMAMTIEACRFPVPGLYVVELFCDNAWVCDIPLLLS